ncbi:CRISPR-associated endoribonuclease Cas6 [Streptomyces sp. ST2-7A]|uniref:CRISPR-associated endoribonuclease Cas6 n=1 Tax=Streptomyces sp. ST2-7A TaxID=2907214 RepID=UPI001F30BCA7|nr:CRISPR-associated endoribonuclease Cas6 [Streptomyces sp. ST2-7A]
MVPFGHGAPVFPLAHRVRGRYAAGGPGTVEFGSPVPQLAETPRKGFAERELLDWGGVALRLTRIEVIPPTGVLLRPGPVAHLNPGGHEGASRDEGGERVSRPPWLLPDHEEWGKYIEGNLVRKAETLGMDPAVKLEAVTRVGSQRSFRVGGGARPGAPVEMALSGPTETLRTLWSRGLGQANAAGFGWIIPHPTR